MKPKKKRLKAIASGRQNAKIRTAQIVKLIENLTYLVRHSTGLKHFSYKQRLHNAVVALKDQKRAMRPKRRPGQTPYLLNPKGFQGGAPGLIQQR